MKAPRSTPSRSVAGVERIMPRARWDDLDLPARERRSLREVADRLKGGDGGIALFAGPGGTGKTLAAEIIAGQLGLDLLRIDVARVVGKYIGETEKNLARVFDEAERNGAVLLFDEADALFGKRSGVRDGHDRFANADIAYLLQRIEAHPGLSILATNKRQNIDPAFLRRLRFAVNFAG